ncbi:MAG: ribokinase [Bryobacteraceae bacterium]
MNGARREAPTGAGRRIFVVGSANMDLVMHIPRLPVVGETLTGSDLKLVPGGKGANQACAAAQLGGDVYFVGCTGPDAFGPRLAQSLTEAGVNVTRMRMSGKPTGCASIYVQPDGQNSIVISPGANTDLSPGHVRTALHDLRSDDFVLLQLEIPLETVEFTLQAAQAAGATAILDPAPAISFDSGTLRLVHILTPNQTEAAMLLGREKLCPDPTDIELARLGSESLKLGPTSVVLKLGEAGCAIFSREHRTKIDGYSVRAIDTTAAGDVFNGALAVAMAENRTLFESAGFANAAAALSVTRSGAQSSIPTRRETEELIRTAGATRVRDLPSFDR